MRAVQFILMIALLSGCAGSIARTSFQSDDEIYKYVKSGEDKDLCSHYRTVLRHYGRKSDDTALRYLKAVERVASESDVNIYTCSIDINEIRYSTERYWATKGYLSSCRIRYALKPLESMEDGKSTLAEISQPAKVDKQTQKIASEVYERLKYCQKNYKQFAKQGSVFGPFVAKLADLEQEILVSAYQGRIDSTQLKAEFDRLNEKLEGGMHTGSSDSEVTSTSQGAARNAELQASYEKLQEATVNGYKALSNSLGNNETSMKCRPDKKWELLGQPNMICEPR